MLHKMYKYINEKNIYINYDILMIIRVCIKKEIFLTYVK